MTISKKKLRTILLQETNRELSRGKNKKLNRSQLRNIISETVVSLDEGKPDEKWGPGGKKEVDGQTVYRRHKRPYEYIIKDGEWHGRKIGSKGKYKNVHKYVVEKFKVEFKDAPVGEKAKKEEEKPPTPKDGKCPEGWVLSDDKQTCVKKDGGDEGGGEKAAKKIRLSQQWRKLNSDTISSHFKAERGTKFAGGTESKGEHLTKHSKTLQKLIDSGKYDDDSVKFMEDLVLLIRKNNYVGQGRRDPHNPGVGCYTYKSLGNIPLKDIPSAKHILAKSKREKDDTVGKIKVCYNKPKPASADDFTSDKITSITVWLGREGIIATSKDYYVRGKQITDKDLDFLKAMIKF
tara:strand:- start:807 stop:1850 length:1044 start_codon:yes stop_codon:yes gene_type:complete